jgi:hypothetical protein
MDAERLQDRIRWGLNVAARTLGVATDVYRPSGVSEPLRPSNRILRMHAAFSAQDGRFSQPDGFGAALWHGLFDAAYTQPGDYLVQDGAVWFIAAQQRLLPVLCVRTTRTLSFSRAGAPTSTGVNSYGGITAVTTTPLLTGWPASVLGASGGGRPDTDLPGDTTVPYWSVLLPAWPGVTLLTADLLTDDLGRNATVAAAELTALGWRVTAKQATT